MEDLSEAARSVWAKSLNREGAWLPLWQHMDDSADVAGRLFDEWLAPSVARIIAHEFGGDVASARTAARFLAGVHDIGKATPAFAVQDTYLGQRMSALGLRTPSHKNELEEREKAHHTITGHGLLRRWLENRGWNRRTAEAWAVVVGGHHGVPPESDELAHMTPDGYPQLYGEGRWDDVRRELLERQARRTGTDRHLERWADVKLSQQSQVLLTGLVIVADWIASNDELFPFHADQLPEVASHTHRSEHALDRLQLPAPWRVTPEPDIDVGSLFASRFQLPNGAVPRPVQVAAVEMARQASEPGLLIVEAPMGEGKTEAALAAAEIMAGHVGAGGLFVALPTQATTDAMFARVVDWLDALGANTQQVGGSIMLAHGKKRFNPLFQGMQAAGRLRDIGRDRRLGGRGACSGKRDANDVVVAHSWLTGRKKSQLANVTVGTIDQILFAGLKSRHLMLRHLGLAGKIAILDEIHAYDAYMGSYLVKVMTWLGAYRVPVVALSATLPAARRRELVEGYQRGRARAVGAPDEASPSSSLDDDPGYPVLTWTDGVTTGTRVAEPSGRGTSIHLEALVVDEDGDDDESLVRTLKETLSDGGTALVVRNTVRRVLATAVRLEREFPGEVTVAHSRFITADRVRKDTELLERFGPPERARRRPMRHVVVASQVVEQSLDVDFDVLVTDLAPVDLVLQRMGRLHRHQRGEGQHQRPAKVRTARAYIGGTDFAQSPPALEPLAEQHVYSAHVLLRAAAVLLPRLGGVVELPSDIAPLVQHAYGDEPIGPIEWRDDMAEARADLCRKTERREDRAATFQIADPGNPGKAIVGWIRASVGDADDEAAGQGQVRDGAPSLEAILVQRSADGRLHTPAWLDDGRGDLTVPEGQPPPDDLGEVLAACSIRLPLAFSNPDAEDNLWKNTPEGWEESPLIYRLPALVVDDDGWGEINGRRVRYTAGRGLEVFDSDGE